LSENINWATLGLGAIIGAGITAFINFIIKEREFYRDIVKHKIESVSKSKSNAIQLSEWYRKLVKTLYKNQKNIDYSYCLYVVCNILAIDRRILEQDGQLQLDDLETEHVLAKFKSKVKDSLLAPLDEFEKDKLAYIFEKNEDYVGYHKFYKNFFLSMDNRDILYKFESNIKNMNKTNIKELILNAMCFAQLNVLEINQIYELWYRSGPTLKNYMNFSKLNENVLKKLQEQEEYKSYYKRICKYDDTKIQKFKKALRDEC
jgi:hypothetical protein